MPAITLPVALVGTLAGIWLAGFSINILTLLALVLATGLVVDDAIVVLENIVRRRREGLGARAAAVLGTREVFFAVITTTATLAAVFVPLSFLPGKAGGLFREFGFVLAIAVVLSSCGRAVAVPDARLAVAARSERDDRESPSRAAGRVGEGASDEGAFAAGVRGRASGSPGRTPGSCTALSRRALPVLLVSIGFAALAWISFGNLERSCCRARTVPSC